MGDIGILNVGAGDTKLTFDKNNPAECIRAARIVKDMLRRGYALLVEVDDGAGGRKTERVLDFREDSFEYIIADLDPVATAREDEDGEERTGEQAAEAQPPHKSKTKAHRRHVDATRTSGVAVARTAGG